MVVGRRRPPPACQLAPAEASPWYMWICRLVVNPRVLEGLSVHTAPMATCVAHTRATVLSTSTPSCGGWLHGDGEGDSTFPRSDGHQALLSGAALLRGAGCSIERLDEETGVLDHATARRTLRRNRRTMAAAMPAVSCWNRNRPVWMTAAGTRDLRSHRRRPG